MTGTLARWIWGDAFAAPEPLPAWRPQEAAGDWLRSAEQVLERLKAAEAAASRRAHAAGTAAPGEEMERELRRFCLSLLPSLDSIDRLIEFGEKSVRENPDLRNWLVALEGMRLKMGKSLEKIGMTPISSVGAKVDLNLHEVVRTVHDPTVPPETVVAETQRGYYFRGKLLRDAKVVVSVGS
jgi:molecular chaperone GrpE (heat shock protein)